MKISITGTTESVITFNTLGIVLRGKQTAGNLDITTDEQRNEIIVLKRAGFINVRELEPSRANEYPIFPEAKPITKPDIKLPNESLTQNLSGGSLADDIGSSMSDDVEDLVFAPTNTQAVQAPKRPGRPKGSKNKIKTISRCNYKNDESGNESGREVIIGTASGIRKGNMVHSAVESKEDPENVRESLEAMEEIKKEEASKSDKIDESTFELHERNGGKAYIATGESIQQINAVNSVLPESDNIKNRDPFIDKDIDVEPEFSDQFLEYESKDKKEGADPTNADDFIEM
ncbi:MAG: hypothetical protein WC375_07285 [Methanomassiliicoccales archaeon]|jgi:hypothetical protein